MRILMIVMSDVLNDARVLREARELREAGHQVTILGDREPSGGAPLDEISVRWARASTRSTSARLAVPRALRWLLLPQHRRREMYRFSRAVTLLGQQLPAQDVVHGHDLSALGPAAGLAERWGARLVYDAHECWTGRKLAGRPAPMIQHRERRLEARLGHRADKIITVSEGIAAWLVDAYGWSRVEVVHNSFPDLGYNPPIDRPVGMLYAGRLDRKRDLDTVAKASNALLDLSITAIGPDDGSGLRARLSARLDVRPPVPLDELDRMYRERGLALVTLRDDSLNHRLALPNKLFQAVRAGVPVIAADLPELRRVVTHHQLGTLYRPGDHRSFVVAVTDAIGRYAEFVRNVEVARDELSWNSDAPVLLNIYEELDKDSR